MTRFGRERGLAMYADWTDRIAAGEVPEAPPRPQGAKRNVVVTVWDWSDDKGFVHDTISTDKRNPTLNANGPIYSISRFSAPEMNILDPKRHTASGVTVPVRDPNTADSPTPQTVVQPSPYWGDEIIWSSSPSLHNPMMDDAGRIWLTHAIRVPTANPAFCKAGSTPPVRAGVPAGDRARHLSLYDPKTKKFTFIDTCYGTHHLQFAEDANNTLWMSSGGGGGRQVLGWFNTKMFDSRPGTRCGRRAGRRSSSTPTATASATRTSNPTSRSIRPRTSGSRAAATASFPSPVDGSIWVAAPGVPGSIIRVVPGANPTADRAVRNIRAAVQQSQVTGQRLRAARHRHRSQRVVWTGLAGSGHLASFDRRKCKVLNGPTATGSALSRRMDALPDARTEVQGRDRRGERGHAVLQLGRSVRHVRPGQEHARS